MKIMSSRFMRQNILKLIFAVTSLMLWTGRTKADPIPTLFNTGVDAQRVPRLDNDMETHYVLLSGPPPVQMGTPVVATSAGGFPIGPWNADNTISAWIAPRADTRGPTGDYIYRTTFKLTGFISSSAAISGVWAVDNRGLDIVLNGIPLGIPNPRLDFDFAPFSITNSGSLFRNGENTLDFVVRNGEDYTPTGLRVEMSGTANRIKFGDIATRGRIYTGPSPLIGGLILTGTAGKRVIFRAIGPSLTPFLDDALADPTLELFQGDTLLASNDNWRTDQEAEIEATGIPPTNDRESAIVATLDPGAYTAILRGKDNGAGMGLVEVYDLDLAADSMLANISTRGFVGTGDDAMIGGFIMSPPGEGVATVIARAIGPTLINFGIDDALQDPTLELVNSDGVVIRSNNDWKDSQPSEIIATGIPPSNDRESAVVETLAPGNYTVIVRGVGNTTGVALVEVYLLQ